MTESGDKFDLAKRLRELSDERGLSFKHLSIKSGVPLKTIYGWSAGNRPRNLQDLQRVAECLGVSITELSFSSVRGEQASHAPSQASHWIAQWRQGAGLPAGEAARAAGIRIEDLLAYETQSDVPVSVFIRLIKIYRQDFHVVVEKIESLYKAMEV